MEIIPALKGPRMLLARRKISDCDSFFAEDLGRALQLLRRHFRVAGVGCNLWLNPPKTQVLPLFAEGEDVLNELIRDDPLSY